MDTLSTGSPGDAVRSPVMARTAPEAGVSVTIPFGRHRVGPDAPIDGRQRAPHGPGSMPIGELMSADPIVVWPDTPMGDVADLLERFEIAGVPVVDWTGYAMGVVSRMDVLRVSRGSRSMDDWRSLEARLAMTTAGGDDRDHRDGRRGHRPPR